MSTEANNIMEGNKLIALFMGWQTSTFHNLPDRLYKNDEGIHISNLLYHTSWDWLMPVVEKIEKDVSVSIYYGFTVVIADTFCSIKCHEKNKQDGIIYQTPYGIEPNSKNEATWQAVVEFIKWHNQQQKEQL